MAGKFLRPLPVAAVLAAAYLAWKIAASEPVPPERRGCLGIGITTDHWIGAE